MPEVNLRKVDLNQLLVLLVLLETCNVTRAADRIGLSQPGMSRALARLRADFSDPLLVRSGRVMYRTPRGDALLAELGAVLDLAATLYRPIVFDPAKAERVFRAVLPDVVAASVLPALVAALAAAAPGCRLDIVPWLGARRGSVAEVDFAITTEPQLYPGFRMEQLYRDHDVLVHAKCDMVPAGPLESLLALGHIAVVAASLDEDPVDRWLREIGMSRCIAAIVPTYLQAAHLAASTGLVAILPTRFVAAVGKRLDLASVPLPIEQETDQQWLLYPIRTQADPASLWLRDLVRRASGDA